MLKLKTCKLYHKIEKWSIFAVDTYFVKDYNN